MTYSGWRRRWTIPRSFSGRKRIRSLSGKGSSTPGILGNPSGLPHTYLLYDSDCGPCTRFMRVAKVLDLHGELIPVSIHAKQAQRLVRGNLSPNRLKSSFHIVEITNSGSKIYSAGDGLVRLTRYAPGGKITFAAVSRIKFFRQVLRWTYYQGTRLRAASKSCSIGGYPH